LTYFSTPTPGSVKNTGTPCAELWLESRNDCDDPFEIIAVIHELRQLHSAVCDIFKEVSNKRPGLGRWCGGRYVWGEPEGLR